MNQTIKRRLFVGGGIGMLLGFPIALNYWTSSSRRPKSVCQKQLEHYRQLLDVSVVPIGDVTSFTWRVMPNPGSITKYVSVMESYLPPALSRVASGEPDSFLVTEGSIVSTTTKEGVPLLAGQDTVYKQYLPFDSIDQELSDFLLIVKNNELVPMIRKGDKSKNHDSSFIHLLSLHESLRETKPGTTFRGNTGRVRPFKGINTVYTIAGFEKVGERSTVKVHFDVKNLDFNKLGEKNPLSDTKITSFHNGDAWFDLETGLLVRQVTDIHSVVTGDLRNGKTNKKSVSDFHGIYTIQLFEQS